MKVLKRLFFSGLILSLATQVFASEADLAIPDLHAGSYTLFGVTITAWQLLFYGALVICGTLGISLFQFFMIKKEKAHVSMLKVAEIIYQTCRTYLLQQGKFLLMLFAFIAVAMAFYFIVMKGEAVPVLLQILLFSVIGMGGSYSVAWYGIRVNTLANARTAFASLEGKPWNVVNIPLRAGMSVGLFLISLELVMMVIILLFVPRNIVGYCFLGFAIGESLGASALRIAGGIFTKIADIGSDLMKIVFKVKEDDPRNPGVIADCTGDNAGDSVGPTADGFETYGVTGVALISFITLAITVPDIMGRVDIVKVLAGIGIADASKEVIDAIAKTFQAELQSKLIVWIFAMRFLMDFLSGCSYFVNQAISTIKYKGKTEFDFEEPLMRLIWIAAILCISVSFGMSYLLLGNLDLTLTADAIKNNAEIWKNLAFAFPADVTVIKFAEYPGIWWKLALIISCGTLAAVLIPEFTKIFTSSKSKHVNEIVTATREGGASLTILSGIVAGNFSAFWMGLLIAGLMAGAFITSTFGLADVMGPFASIFAFGMVAFGFLCMGPVTIAVDSYGPVTDNAQSIFELSQIEAIPNINAEIKKDYGFDPNFELGKHFLEANDGAGNTFKATAKPVLIGTAVVGATTMIFAIILLLKSKNMLNVSLTDAPVLLGLICGGAVIFWFAGASMQAVTTGAYRAVEFIKKNLNLNKAEADLEDSKTVVKICTQYAQKGMWNIFIALMCLTLAFAFIDPNFFVAYLISIACFGLFEAIYMANAGGAWDNAKKVVEVDLKEKGSELHAASVIGDTVGDPFKDTSSVSMNPIIKFSTLFGLLATEIAIAIKVAARDSSAFDYTAYVAVVFFIIGLIFVWRSFFAMRIPPKV
ncbi:MAG: sodium-translocating pyrophosphatase [Spirochaetes bacterium]|nr:sodium-translocating pyrophosphatase [Spirochaetota bacterium]HOD13079.1 sodium-translocating pyrophosphatase [Spirochaetota bacterium]HPG52540.1 sodium-translocating pyrophosphatase [Spirochaetota bacterium]